MDWLDAIAAFLLGWFGKKLKRFAEAVLDGIWTLVRCGPTWRCWLFMTLYTEFLRQATVLRNAGHLHGPDLQRVRRFTSWATPKMDAWIERTGPGTPAWQDELAQLERNRARRRVAA